MMVKEHDARCLRSANVPAWAANACEPTKSREGALHVTHRLWQNVTRGFGNGTIGTVEGHL